MATIYGANSALDHARRSGTRGLFWLASSILRRSIHLYERRMILPVVLRGALSAVRLLERSAAVLVFGSRSHDDLEKGSRPR
jgi:hypothetical protein